jgi:hypothetical protein
VLIEKSEAVERGECLRLLVIDDVTWKRKIDILQQTIPRLVSRPQQKSSVCASHTSLLAERWRALGP